MAIGICSMAMGRSFGLPSFFPEKVYQCIVSLNLHIRGPDSAGKPKNKNKFKKISKSWNNLPHALFYDQMTARHELVMYLQTNRTLKSELSQAASSNEEKTMNATRTLQKVSGKSVEIKTDSWHPIQSSHFILKTGFFIGQSEKLCTD